MRSRSTLRGEAMTEGLGIEEEADPMEIGEASKAEVMDLLEEILEIDLEAVSIVASKAT